MYWIKQLQGRGWAARYRIAASIVVLNIMVSWNMAAQGMLYIHQPAEVEQLLQRSIAINKERKQISGWSVMIMVTDDRTRADEAKIRFLRQFPDINADWDFETPYYRLKAGAFLNKIEAYGLMLYLKAQYPDCYVIKNTRIRPRDLQYSPVYGAPPK
jgi:hypothetical protein